MKTQMLKIIKILNSIEKYVFWGLLITLVIFRIWLITGIPKMFIYGPHDDLFYGRAAQSILRGQWMGAYDGLTLIKGPFYAFFLIASFFSGLPLYLIETLFYIVACVVLVFAITPIIKNKWTLLAIFIFILFIPSSINTWFHLRVYREFVYYSLTLYVTAFTIGLLLRTHNNIHKMIFWSTGLGISMGAFLLTREEGVWIYPVLITILLIGIIRILFSKQDQKLLRSIIQILPIALWYLPVLFVSYLNYHHYGYFGVTEQLDPEFNRVLNTLARIETESWHPAIQITREARLMAYDVSPTLAEHENRIENYVLGWKPAHDGAMRLKPDWYLNQYGDGGEEIGNGHFLWLMRSIPVHTGLYADGEYPRYFFRQIGDELEAACVGGDLNCKPKSILPAMAGTIDYRHYPIITRMARESFLKIVGQRLSGISSLNIKAGFRPWPSDNEEYWVFEQFSYNPVETINTISDDDLPRVIYGITDLRYRVLIHKNNMMDGIASFYQFISTPLFIISSIIFIYFLIIITIMKEKNQEIVNLFVLLFILGLLFSRLFTLSIIDAISSIPAMNYGASTQLFPAIFSILTIPLAVKTIKNYYLPPDKRII